MTLLLHPVSTSRAELSYLFACLLAFMPARSGRIASKRHVHGSTWADSGHEPHAQRRSQSVDHGRRQAQRRDRGERRRLVDLTADLHLEPEAAEEGREVV